MGSDSSSKASIESSSHPFKRTTRWLLQTPQRRLIVLSGTLIVLLHLVLFYVVWFQDRSVSGRAQRWLHWHGLVSLQPSIGKNHRLQHRRTSEAVVVFLHVQRTGGISVKRNLHKTDYQMKLHHPHLLASLDKESHEIETILNSTTATHNTAKHGSNRFRFGGGGGGGLPRQQMPTTHFVVLHEQMGHLANVKDQLARWRLLAQEHHKILFMFTLVRDPVDYAVSCFNEYRVEPCVRDACLRPLLEPTAENLVQTLRPNEQCAGLVQSTATMMMMSEGDGPPPPLSEQNCTDVYEWMTQHLDWIGTTDTLNTYTLPLLAEFMLGDADRAERFEVWNPQEKETRLKASDLDEATKHKIRQVNALDQQLYDRVKANYYF